MVHAEHRTGSVDVLIVDDSRPDARKLEDVLAARGATVAVDFDLDAARARLDREQPAVVVTDWDFGRSTENGLNFALEAYQTLRERPGAGGTWIALASRSESVGSAARPHAQMGVSVPHVVFHKTDGWEERCASWVACLFKPHLVNEHAVASPSRALALWERIYVYSPTWHEHDRVLVDDEPSFSRFAAPMRHPLAVPDAFRQQDRPVLMYRGRFAEIGGPQAKHVPMMLARWRRLAERHRRAFDMRELFHWDGSALHPTETLPKASAFNVVGDLRSARSRELDALFTTAFGARAQAIIPALPRPEVRSPSTAQKDCRDANWNNGQDPGWVHVERIPCPSDIAAPTDVNPGVFSRLHVFLSRRERDLLDAWAAQIELPSKDPPWSRPPAPPPAKARTRRSR